MMRSPHDSSQPDAAAWTGAAATRGPAALPGPAAFGFCGGLYRDAAAREPFAEASGILRALPEAVAVPGDPEDLAALVRWAGSTGTALVPRGAGTGMPGGNLGRGIAVDLVSGFRAAPAIDAQARRARIAPGITLAALNAAAAPHALHFPVDPSSGEVATLGGMIANNSGGAHTVRHGSTRRWVQGVELVLADGAHASLRRGEPTPPALAAIQREVDAALAPGPS